MTIIVAATDGLRTCIAADKLNVIGKQKVSGVNKLIEFEEYKTKEKIVIASAGYTTMDIGIQKAMSFDLRLTSENPYQPFNKLLIKKFILEATGYAKEHINEWPGNISEEDLQSNFVMFAKRGHILSIDANGNIEESRNGYLAVGAGAKYALGSLYSTFGKSFENFYGEKIGVDLVLSAKLAVEAANYYHVHCGEGMDLVTWP